MVKKEEKRIIEEQPPIATIEGWEDGQPFTRGIHKLDRWALQSADTVTIHIGQHNVILKQDPHSNHLGGYIWLTSIVFCSYLNRLAELKKKDKRHQGWINLDRNKRWIELGSGIGLIGIMLHKLGIENVMITDIGELVETMERNVVANDIHVKSVTGRIKNEKEDNYIVVDPLFWNNMQEMSVIKRNLTEAEDEEIDYIVACDCIYSEASAIDLIETMDYLANEITTIICISEVRNQQAQDLFLKEAKSRFLVELVPAIQWQKKLNNKVEFDETLNLYLLSKKKDFKKKKTRAAAASALKSANAAHIK